MNSLDNPGRRRLFRGKVAQVRHLRLPWSISESVFTAGCVQCSDCIKVCETQIIGRDEQGFPVVDFSKGECSLCQKCVQVCEQPLFTLTKQLDESLDKQALPWPIEFSIKEQCLAKNNVYCQSCRDVCETAAIKFTLHSSIATPSLDNADCSQCGACVSSCPQDAIVFNFQPSQE